MRVGLKKERAHAKKVVRSLGRYCLFSILQKLKISTTGRKAFLTLFGFCTTRCYHGRLGTEQERSAGLPKTCPLRWSPGLPGTPGGACGARHVNSFRNLRLLGASESPTCRGCQVRSVWRGRDGSSIPPLTLKFHPRLLCVC